MTLYYGFFTEIQKEEFVVRTKLVISRSVTFAYLLRMRIPNYYYIIIPNRLYLTIILLYYT